MTSTKACLIVGQDGDVHVDALLRELKARDVRGLFFASDADPGVCFVSYAFGAGAPQLTVRREGVTLRAADIDSVLWRVKGPLQGLPSADPDAADEDFRYREWAKAVAGLESALPQATWVNRPGPHGLAGNKLLQLRTAGELGFRVPPTVVSNDASEIEPLFETGAVIYKTLSTPFHSDNKLILTTVVAKEDFDARREHLSAAPCLFQGLVAKAYELRVTVIGRSIVAMRIDSQSAEATKVDWRADQLRAEMYTLVVLPSAINAQIMKLMERLGLVYGAIDLIVTPEGEYVFLEVNPGGQWLWLEELTGTPITAEIAAFLATGQPMRFGCDGASVK